MYNSMPLDFNIKMEWKFFKNINYKLFIEKKVLNPLLIIKGLQFVKK